MALIAWFLMGSILAPFAYARTLAHFQRKWPQIADEQFCADRRHAVFQAAMVQLVFPVILLSLFLGQHGFMWKWKK